MNFREFDLKSAKLLDEVNPKLKELMEEVLRRSKVVFIVTEGVRTKKTIRAVITREIANF